MAERLGKTLPVEMWACKNMVTGQISCGMGPLHIPELYMTLKEACRSNNSMTNKLGHKFRWVLVALTEVRP